jgi:uncharacterized protein (DUF2062 family)
MSSMLVWWAGEPASQLLTWRAGESWERPWTLWTSAWVHIHTPHLITNQMAVGVLAAWAWFLRPDRLPALAWFLAWPISTVTLGAWPQIGYCVGSSGVLHAGIAIMGTFMLLGYFQHSGERVWGGLLLLGLSLKLLIEQGWHLPVVWDDAANLSLVRAIHLTGSISGMASSLLVVVVYAIVFNFLRQLRRQSRLGDI